MGKTIVQATIPFKFAPEGKYDVSMDEKSALIDVNVVRNSDGFKNIVDSKMSVSPEAFIDLRDHHGIFNFSRVTIELSYDIEPNTFELKDIQFPPNVQVRSNTNTFTDYLSPIRRECLKYLNRLLDVVRSVTGNYWISSISDRDFFLSSSNQMFDDGTIGLAMPMMPVGAELDFPNKRQDEQSAKPKIMEILKEERPIPFYHNLYLDSLNYYSTAKFNEAVIMINIFLEASIEAHLEMKLMNSGLAIDDVDEKISAIFGDKFHKVMRTHFESIDGRTFDESHQLWQKFNNARLVRKKVMHPRTKMLDEFECRTVIENILEIVQWVHSSESG